MKRSVFVLLAALLLPTLASPASAQERILFGVNGGAVYSNIGLGGSDWAWGGSAGVVAGFQNWNYTIFSIEANWARRGDSNFRMDYVEFPLLFGGVVGSNIRARLYTGIALGIELSCSNSGFVDIRYSCSRTDTSQWSWPFGVQIGRYNPGARFMALDVRYSYSLSDAFETSVAYHRGWEFKVVLGTSRIR
jgi:hypothetical protein